MIQSAKIGLLLSLMAMAVSCATVPPPDQGGTIVHQQGDLSYQSYAIHTISLDGQTVGLILPATFKLHEQASSLTQPTNPASEATIVTPALTASIPASRTGPPPSTPVDRAMGGMVYIGSALLLLGVAGVALRWLPFSFGRVIPLGVSIMIALSGGLLIAYASLLDQAPWWVIALAVGAVVAIGGWFALRDNLKLTRAAATPEASNG
ncbi:MAG: hypothetical protein IT446_06585 [Phycisphaerales bacterium]|nr:hypothetical protein [Phycisphaerales bacterium]